MRVPAQPKTFLLMADQLDLWVRCARGHYAVLGSVEDQNLAVDSERRDDVGILRLVARLVDLARVVDLLGDVELDDGRLPRRALVAIAANLACRIVVVVGARNDRLGKLNLGNLEVVGLALSRVGSDEQPMDRVVVLFHVLDIGKPLRRQCRPLQRRACGLSAGLPRCAPTQFNPGFLPQNHVVEKRAVLLPRLVLWEARPIRKAIGWV